MATKETGDRRSAGWTARYNRRGRAESADRMPRTGIGVSEGQDREAPPFSTIPADARDNESCQEYSQSLRQDADDTSVNLGTSSDYPTGVREPEPVSQKRGGASVVVSGQESCPPGEGRQSDAVQRWTQTKPEAGGIDRLLTAQKQTALALKASREPDYRFDHLYDLLHWDRWIRCAADAVLARPGSRTEGVDGKTRNNFLNQYKGQIAHLVQELKAGTYQPLPARRVHIPKANGKTRPLGIATLRDRIVQEALRMMLDPIYESDFQPYSFGFRKGRNTMDAVAVLMPLFNRSAKHYYVIEGDLKSYFDTVNHRKLLSLLKRHLKDKKLLDLLWKFLKAGVMEGQLFITTDEGVPQGGCVSPLLANLYLNEFDQWAEAKWHRRGGAERQKIRAAGGGNYVMVRFADDFVVVSNDAIQGVRHTKDEIKTFLEGELKLTLSEEKTCITHVNDGFDFLGFHLQRVHSEGRWVVHLRPAAKSMKRAKDKLKALTDRSQTLYDEVTKLGQINQVVRGWCHYYRYTSFHRDLEAISRYAWHRYLRWLLKKHKGSHKHQLIKDKTRRLYQRERWIATTGERTLHQWLPSPRELKRSRYRQKGRQGFPHPYLGNEDIRDSTLPTGQKGPDESIYQTVRGLDGQRQFPRDWHERRLQVLQRDGFACTRCGTRTNLQVHHKRGLKSWKRKELETLCRKCHLQAHGYKVRMTSDGEPDAFKEARPVRGEG